MIFTSNSVIKWDLKAVDRRLKEHTATLKTKGGKERAKARAEEEKQAIRDKLKRLKNNKYKNIVIEFSAYWVRSYTWGYNPQGNIIITAYNTTTQQHERETFSGSVSGCGYDKLSSVFANLLNDSLIIKSYLISKIRKLNTLNNVYGLYDTLDFMGGTGISCYKNIFESLGFKWYHNDTSKLDHITITQ